MNEINSKITNIKLELDSNNIFKIEIKNEDIESTTTYDIEISEYDAAKLAIGIYGVLNKAGKLNIIEVAIEDMKLKTIH
jgi:hypothetical protein